MKNENDEILTDLLLKKAVYGLDEAESEQLKIEQGDSSDDLLRSFEITVAAIALAGVEKIDEMPALLRSSIVANFERSHGSETLETSAPWPPAEAPVYGADEIFGKKSRPSLMSWLGWAAAAAACIALALNIWFSRSAPTENIASLPTPPPSPRSLTPAESREDLLRSGGVMTTAAWAPGNVGAIKDVTGDVVWSDQKQTGFMRFRDLPVNDPATTCYQLWIFDKTQDKATPIDGGIFDVTDAGEVIVKIDPKLTAVEPAMFAITIERHGGVVVSKRDKIAALAKVETSRPPSA